MASKGSFSVLLCTAVLVWGAATDMPPPFTRTLVVQQPPLTGQDVLILQNLLNNPPSSASLSVDGAYGPATGAALSSFLTCALPQPS